MLIHVDLKDKKLLEESRSYSNYIITKFSNISAYSKFPYNRMQWWREAKFDINLIYYIIKKYDIKNIFEVGTCLGTSTLAMWMHPNIKHIKTIDVNNTFEGIPDMPGHEFMDKIEYGKHFKNIVSQEDIELEFVDSTKYVPKEKERYDMVYIDGNHKKEYVQNDTVLALKFKPRIIVWHDFPNEPGVNEYLTKISEKFDIFVVSLEFIPNMHSILAFYFPNEEDKQRFLKNEI